MRKHGLVRGHVLQHPLSGMIALLFLTERSFLVSIFLVLYWYLVLIDSAMSSIRDTGTTFDHHAHTPLPTRPCLNDGVYPGKRRRLHDPSHRALEPIQNDTKRGTNTGLPPRGLITNSVNRRLGLYVISSDGTNQRQRDGILMRGITRSLCHHPTLLVQCLGPHLAS